jgi:hypothetical protein
MSATHGILQAAALALEPSILEPHAIVPLLSGELPAESLH